MNKYKITYVVMGSSSPMPLEEVVPGNTEEEAKITFMCSGKFYNTNDLSKVVISSIRICK